MEARSPGTSGLALLGLLALRPFTGYELAGQTRRSLRFFWPRSDAHVYAEVKRLERAGLATASTERTGRRSRTSYAITEDGRKALAAWLTTPPAAPQLEIEGLLRLTFADQAGKEEVLAAIRQTRAAVLESAADGVEQVRGYLADGGPFPARLHLIALLSTFYSDFTDALVDWCDAAEAEIATWPGTRDVGLTPGTRRMLEEVLERHEARTARTAKTR